jgi:hypothetical protein
MVIEPTVWRATRSAQTSQQIHRRLPGHNGTTAGSDERKKHNRGPGDALRSPSAQTSRITCARRVAAIPTAYQDRARHAWAGRQRSPAHRSPSRGMHQPRGVTDLVRSIFPWMIDLRIRAAARSMRTARPRARYPPTTTTWPREIPATPATVESSLNSGQRRRKAGLTGRPRFPSFILPGLDFSKIAPVLSAITSKTSSGPY